MSTSPTDRDEARDDHQPPPTPVPARSPPQDPRLAIRIVPYSPPRLDGQSRSASQSSSQPPLTDDISRNERRQASNATSTSSGTQKRESKERTDHATFQGSALSSPSSSSNPALPLVGLRGDLVSPSRPAHVLTNARNDTNIGTINAPTSQPQPSQNHPIGDDDDATSSRPASSGSARPSSRRRNFITVHADSKTFSLVPRGPPSDTLESQKSPLTFSSIRTSSSHERLSLSAFSDDRPSSPPTSGTTIPDYSLSSLTSSPGSSTINLGEDPLTGSPWNYRMVGGLRKVPKTPDFKQKGKGVATSTSPDDKTLPALPTLPEISYPRISEEEETPAEESSPVQQTPSRTVLPKTSFGSENTDSTTFDTTNYKLYGNSSSAEISVESLHLPSSDDSPNVRILGQSSPAPTAFESSPLPPRTADSEDNYVVHGESSPAASLIPVRRPRPTYSQESLRVPPLQPTRRRSNEKFGYYKSRSRESLRKQASLQSISSLVSQDSSTPLIVASAFLPHRGTSSRPGSSNQQPDTWASTSATQPADSRDLLPSSFSTQPLGYQMGEPHPHVWSSQLSTVMSEDEGSSVGPRTVSAMSESPSGYYNGARRPSVGWSTHSRQMLSISSSLAQQLAEDSQQGSHSRSNSRSNSRSDSLTYPQAAHQRNYGGPSNQVRDLDEDGDGLTDLPLSQQQSRSGLSAFFSSSSSGRGLQSSASSRSFQSGPIPQWARLYYGSGEHGRLGPPSISEMSDESRPPSSYHASGSPNTDTFPLNIHNTRKRPREVRRGFRSFSSSGSMEVTEVRDYQPPLRPKTSSIWSPHLWMDRRADRYSMWDPPSVDWSAESGSFGKRNIQVILFVVGFIFPFAWMIASFLPLPPKPALDEEARKHGKFGMPESFRRQIQQVDDIRYQNTRWWRRLNRFMAVLGLLILGAVAALVVVGIRQGWGQRIR